MTQNSMPPAATRRVSELREGEQIATLELVNRAEIDGQVATAHAYPRDPVKAEEQMTAMVVATPEVAGECYYSLPRKSRDGSNQTITGPGVRLAEIMAQTWGNIRIACRPPVIGAREVMVEYAAHDLQSNYATTGSVTMGIVTSNGSRYGDDMIRMTCMATTAKARRNAIFAVVPGTMVRRLCDSAIVKATGGDSPLEERVTNAMKHFRAMRISDDRILAAVGRSKIGDLNNDNLAALRGLATAIQDKHTTIDESFPPVDEDKPKGTQAVKEKLKVKSGKGVAKKDAKPKAETQPGKGAKGGDAGSSKLSDGDIDAAMSNSTERDDDGQPEGK
ncbi:MAG: hypothetical protein COA96_16835 [SAR86 cluster bacterium]|uniref:Uncharacterized protein n=1 Tax=SAR86 cluster bacterium TaxID=2030880 RepID=A0A2A5AGB3_9GAMM|nr:MAG: hypothetical protein COA96_16835 [SAR86 cluster bacterium]